MLTVTHAIEHAYAADRAFVAALESAGFQSRWHFHISSNSPAAVVAAYRAKVAADQAMHAAFAVSRVA